MTDLDEAMSGKIHEAMAACVRDMEAVGKDSRNQQQQYNFRSYENVATAVKKAMAKHGVHYTASFQQLLRTEITSKSGTKGWIVVLQGVFHYYAGDGSFVTVTTVGEGNDYGDKATNKAMTACAKYAHINAFCIAEGGDDSENDAHDATHQTVGVGRDDAPTPEEIAAAFGGPKPSGVSARELEEVSLTEAIENARFGEDITDLKERLTKFAPNMKGPLWRKAGEKFKSLPKRGA